MRAQVEPILKLFNEIINKDNLENLVISDDRMHNSIINNIITARYIVLTDLSNKQERKLLVKQKPKSKESKTILLLVQES